MSKMIISGMYDDYHIQFKNQYYENARKYNNVIIITVIMTIATEERIRE